MDIQQSLSGKVIKSPKGYNTYVPNPLLPVIEWTNQLVSALSRADYQLDKLAREGCKLPNLHLLMRAFITRNAVWSSKKSY